MLDCFEGLVLGNPNGHIVVLIIDIIVDFVLDNNLIFPISEVEEDTLVVSALGLANKVLAVLDSAEKDLHSLVDVVESLDRSEFTMNAAAAD